jgi:hypothetical protein
MEGIRRFSAEVEARAKAWREAVSTDWPWADRGKPGEVGGVTQGYFIDCEGIAGFAKPSRSTDPVPTAAQEKIASDLAYDLRLPVPPVLLWDRGERNDGLHRYCAVSLVPFDPANKWGAILRIPTTRDRLLPGFALAASAMVAFDTWIGNSDRVNDGNLIVTEGAGSLGRQYAYIDHGHTMSHGWGEGPAPAITSMVGPYPTQATIETMTVTATIAEIEALSDDHIRSVVDRVPEEFITRQRRECIREGLCRRRDGLRGALVPLIGATQ